MNMEALEGLPPAKEKTLDGKGAMAEIYNKYHNRLIQLCIRKLTSEQEEYQSPNPENDAEDIVQDVFALLLDSVDQPRSGADLSRYLHQSLNNKIDSFMREEGRKEDLAQNLKKCFEGGIDGWRRKEKQILILSPLEQALSELEKRRPRWAEIIKKRYGLGQTLQEIADAYGVPRANIEQQGKRALEKIKEFMKTRKPEAFNYKKLPYTKEEEGFISRLAKNPSFRLGNKVNAKKIAQEVNSRFHNGKNVRTPLAISLEVHKTSATKDVAPSETN